MPCSLLVVFGSMIFTYFEFINTGKREGFCLDLRFINGIKKEEEDAGKTIVYVKKNLNIISLH